MNKFGIPCFPKILRDKNISDGDLRQGAAKMLTNPDFFRVASGLHEDVLDILSSDFTRSTRSPRAWRWAVLEVYFQQLTEARDRAKECRGFAYLHFAQVKALEVEISQDMGNHNRTQLLEALFTVFESESQFTSAPKRKVTVSRPAGQANARNTPRKKRSAAAEARREGDRQRSAAQKGGKASKK